MDTSVQIYARLAGVSNTSIIRSGAYNNKELAERLINHGFEADALVKNGVPPKAVILIIEYYAYISSRPNKQARALLLTFSTIKLMELMDGFKSPTKSLYPDRSQEYKNLYRQLMDLMKRTKAGKHHYINLQQTMNRVANKKEGRTNNSISEMENHIYCMIMEKTINSGELFLKETRDGNLTRKVIKRQIEVLEPKLKEINKLLDEIE